MDEMTRALRAAVQELDTPHGPARVHLDPVDGAVAATVLGHGAGGSVTAPDLVAAAGAARQVGISVALVEQPYRVAGRRSPPPAHKLDASWNAVVEHLVGDALGGLPLIMGGRSSGARVACRTAEQTGAIGVLCLAFPVTSPPRRGSSAAAKTRQPELDAVRVPVLVVQGDRDRFGMPEPGPSRKVVSLPGDHGLKSDLDGIATAVRDWLPEVLRG